MAAVGAGALAGGAAAGAGIKGVAKGAAGSIKAGASMAGGTKLAFTLGSISHGFESSQPHHFKLNIACLFLSS